MSIVLVESTLLSLCIITRDLLCQLLGSLSEYLQIWQTRLRELCAALQVSDLFLQN